PSFRCNFDLGLLTGNDVSRPGLQDVVARVLGITEQQRRLPGHRREEQSACVETARDLPDDDTVAIDDVDLPGTAGDEEIATGLPPLLRGEGDLPQRGRPRKGREELDVARSIDRVDPGAS